MAMVTCLGGHSFTVEPSEWNMIPLERRDSLVVEIVALARQAELNDDELYQSVDWRIETHSWAGCTCPECGRLLLFKNGTDQPGDSYKPE